MQRVVLCLALLVSGCLGEGEGWVVGQLWLDNCEGGRPLGKSLGNPAEFDLHADFFAAEIFEDSNESTAQRMNGIALRIQNTSNNLEISDGMLLQFNDLDLVARRFVQGEPVPIGSGNLCPGNDCPVVEDPLRANLYLFASCPDNAVPMVGSSWALSPTAEDPTCSTATESTPGPACPALPATDRQALEDLCRSDFDDRSSAETIGRIFGAGSCMYLCRFGKAQPGQSADELDGFRLDYGDRVAGIFSTAIVDGRAINLQRCAMAAGRLQGMFNMAVVRGRAAQSFP